MSQIHKQSFSTRLIHFIIAILISLVTITCLSHTVHADGYDFTEGDPAAKGSIELLGGPTWARSGVTFYLVDELGKYVGARPVVYTTTYEGFIDRNGRPLDDENIRVSGRLFPIEPKVYKRGAIDLWGAPWDRDGNYRGIEIREWLLETRDDGHTRAAKLIKDEWGEDYAIRWEDKEVFLVFESVGWNNIYSNGVNTGVCIAGEADFWAAYQYYLEYQGLTSPIGDPMVNRYTNDIYQHAMILSGAPETEKMGLRPTPTRSGKQTNDYLRHYMNGWGMGVVWNEPDYINTYDKSQGSPGPAEDPMPDKVGTKTIVKGYYTENEDTGKKTSDGVYVQKETSKNINIMDEPEYELVEWGVSLYPTETYYLKIK